MRIDLVSIMMFLVNRLNEIVKIIFLMGMTTTVRLKIE